ncbi:hypothetical protein FGO68_gene6326 [Halteria grandinella]|uniref:Uncharacterized protein n=1 Tax=Halteria grandinella TaxID=5974 RepID=A0A8J8NI96_HALGN|nr:hypothetical protein FGO68_gene6326 [Halteria grandinella]
MASQYPFMWISVQLRSYTLSLLTLFIQSSPLMTAIHRIYFSNILVKTDGTQTDWKSTFISTTSVVLIHLIWVINSFLGSYLITSGTTFLNIELASFIAYLILVEPINLSYVDYLTSI